MPLLRERGCHLFREAKESSVNSVCRLGPNASLDQGSMFGAFVLESCRPCGRKKLPGGAELVQRDWFRAFPKKAQEHGSASVVSLGTFGPLMPRKDL